MKALRLLSELVRGAGVGAVATLLDLVVLLFLVEVVGLAPLMANVPALLVGAVAQFIGCRHLVFRATDGALGRQAAGFALTEMATLALNAAAFHLLVAVTAVPYPLARPLGTFLVFVLFSFPVWRLVFRGVRPA